MVDKTKLLIIDDDPKVSWILKEGLAENYDIITAGDGIEGIQVASKEKPPLILLDINMPGMNGLEVLKKLKKKGSDISSDIIMLSGHGQTKNVVEAIRLGAAEFIPKPFDVEEINIHLENVLKRRSLETEVTYLKDQLHAKDSYANFIGDSPAIMEIKGLVEQVADSELSVLVRGESGTGKEIIARMLHNLSSRRNNPFIKVNCAAIPKELLEAELFGYERGAFTGAHKNKPGRFEIANKGTMFLDEIGDMSFELQSKLLQVLEQHEFIRVGGINNIKVDVRIVCATNRNLEMAIAERSFRDDLFYRMNEITVLLPPLRDRKEDIILLVDYFLNKYNNLYKKELLAISHDCLNELTSYNWPGNVRQLENIIKQMVVRQDDKIVHDLLKNAPQQCLTASPAQQPAMVAVGQVAGASEDSDFASFGYSLKKRISRTVQEEEKKLISEVLNKTNWNRRKASELLEISYRSLLYKIKEYKINEM